MCKRRTQAGKKNVKWKSQKKHKRKQRKWTRPRRRKGGSAANYQPLPKWHLSQFYSRVDEMPCVRRPYTKPLDFPDVVFRAGDLADMLHGENKKLGGDLFGNL